MIFKLKTSKETMEILKDLQSRTNLTPNVLSRLAIGLSLREDTPIDEYEADNNGLEFNRQTLTGDYDLIFKVIISQHCNRPLSDEEYFPTYIKKHLDRGIKLLEAEYKYTGNYEKFLIHLVRLNNEVIL